MNSGRSDESNPHLPDLLKRTWSRTKQFLALVGGLLVLASIIGFLRSPDRQFKDRVVQTESFQGSPLKQGAYALRTGNFDMMKRVLWESNQFPIDMQKPLMTLEYQKLRIDLADRLLNSRLDPKSRESALIHKASALWTTCSVHVARNIDVKEPVAHIRNFVKQHQDNRSRSIRREIQWLDFRLKTFLQMNPVHIKDGSELETVDSLIIKANQLMKEFPQDPIIAGRFYRLAILCADRNSPISTPLSDAFRDHYDKQPSETLNQLSRSLDDTHLLMSLKFAEVMQALKEGAQRFDSGHLERLKDLTRKHHSSQVGFSRIAAAIDLMEKHELFAQLDEWLATYETSSHESPNSIDEKIASAMKSSRERRNLVGTKVDLVGLKCRSGVLRDEDTRGKWVIILFWTNTKPFSQRKQMIVQRAQKRLRDLNAVTLTIETEPQEKFNPSGLPDGPFRKESHGLDSQGNTHSIMSQIPRTALSHIVILDPESRVVKSNVRPVDVTKKLESILDERLRQSDAEHP